jgi:oligoribonuclease NrnB/cAMP/cGMP phosphodiesterase (DHH superfamily)
MSFWSILQAKSVTLIDHHKTAIDELKDMPLLKQHVNLDMSGATLAWQYLCGDDMQRPLLLGHIEDRDLWRFKLPLTKEINSAVFSMEYTFANWDNLMASNAAELVQLSVGGAAIARKQAKDIKELLGATARYMQINGETVPVACMPHTMASEAGEALCRLQPNAELENVWAACYYDTAEHRIFSCRSLENGADVSAIAAIYGGGGHKHAAGFRVSRLHALATQ